MPQFDRPSLSTSHAHTLQHTYSRTTETEIQYLKYSRKSRLSYKSKGVAERSLQIVHTQAPKSTYRERKQKQWAAVLANPIVVDVILGLEVDRRLKNKEAVVHHDRLSIKNWQGKVGRWDQGWPIMPYHDGYGCFIWLLGFLVLLVEC